MRLTSTVPGFLELVRHDDPVSQLKWAEEYEGRYPDIFESYYDGFSNESRRGVWAAAGPSLVEHLEVIESAERRATEMARDVETQLKAADLLDDQLDVVLLVGNRTSNAWVAELRDVTTLFLDLELFPAPPYDRVAVLHEAIHVAHVRRGGHGWPEDVGAALFEEGLATAASRLFHPGLTDAEYGWVDGLHQEWATRCEGWLPTLAGYALEHLQDRSEDESWVALFAGDGNHEVFPVRAGYWLADLVLRDWVDTYGLADLLGWSHDKATKGLRAELTRLATF